MQDISRLAIQACLLIPFAIGVMLISLKEFSTTGYNYVDTLTGFVGLFSGWIATIITYYFHQEEKTNRNAKEDEAKSEKGGKIKAETKIMLKKKKDETPVENIMTSLGALNYIKPGDGIGKIKEIVSRGRWNIPVVDDDGNFVNMLERDDILKLIEKSEDTEVETVEKAIKGIVDVRDKKERMEMMERCG